MHLLSSIVQALICSLIGMGIAELFSMVFIPFGMPARTSRDFLLGLVVFTAILTLWFYFQSI